MIGFDPLNEPYVGNTLRRPDLLMPGAFDRKRLQPMYAKVFEKYYANDQDTIMYFEPGTFPNVISYFGGYITYSGFTEPPGAQIGSRNHVFNDHTYCCQLDASVCALGEPSTDLASECYAWHEKRIGKRSQDAERLGVPFFLSEFGACLTEEPCTQEIRQVTEVSDRYLASWAYWEFKKFEDLTTSAGTGSEGFYNNDGSLQSWKVKALARTYLMYTQGVPTLNMFDMDSGVFLGEWTVDTEISKPTVVYFSSEYYYANGVKYDVSIDGVRLGEDQYTVNQTDLYVELLVTDPALNGKTIALVLQGN